MGRSDRISARAVYVIEADLELRRLVTRVLTGLPGLTVRHFDRAEEALGRLQEESPAGLIVALGLPGMGGIEFVVQAQSMRPGVPVLITTARRAEHHRELQRLSAIEIWDKPYPIQDLREWVRSIAAVDDGLLA
jgi:DNA-binding response OmpR family regulator